MLGPLVDSAVIFLGGLGGAALGRHLPARVRLAMPLTCGIIAIGLGALLVTRAQHLPAVALAMLQGAFIGELLYLERGLELAIGWAQRQAERAWPADKGNPRMEGFVARYVTVLVLFCASGMGIFGSINEGMTGQATILLTKSVLDLFTALIFAAELGLAVALIALPQLLIQGGLYLSGSLILPLVSPAMLADFSACGGIILLATGLRICGIKIFPIVNMLPALVLALPCAWLWSRLAPLLGA